MLMIKFVKLIFRNLSKSITSLFEMPGEFVKECNIFYSFPSLFNGPHCRHKISVRRNKNSCIICIFVSELEHIDRNMDVIFLNLIMPVHFSTLLHSAQNKLKIRNKLQLFKELLLLRIYLWVFLSVKRSAVIISSDMLSLTNNELRKFFEIKLQWRHLASGFNNMVKVTPINKYNHSLFSHENENPALPKQGWGVYPKIKVLTLKNLSKSEKLQPEYL